MSKPTSDFFTKELAERYDERNKKLSAVSENLHLCLNIVLENLPPKARILSVGAGTGAEILSLAKSFPEWSFVAVDPSPSMLEVCRRRIEEAGFLSKCEFVEGYAHELPRTETFDAALAILVAHFVKREDRLSFYESMSQRLRPGGVLVNAEISFDLDSIESPAMLKHWEAVQRLMGATPESLAGLSQQLRDILTVVPPSTTENYLRAAGINNPIRFFQTFLISAWSGIKPPTVPA